MQGSSLSLAGYRDLTDGESSRERTLAHHKGASYGHQSPALPVKREQGLLRLQRCSRDDIRSLVIDSDSAMKVLVFTFGGG